MIKEQSGILYKKTIYYILGIVVTTSPTCNLYNIVVLPAPSSPSINIRSSFEPNRPPNIREKNPPSRNYIYIYIKTLKFAPQNYLYTKTKIKDISFIVRLKFVSIWKLISQGSKKISPVPQIFFLFAL